MNILIVGFNLYKGGSLQIREFISNSLLKLNLDGNKYFFFVSSDFNDERLKDISNLKIIKITYPFKLKALNSVYRIFIEQLYPLILNWKYNIDKVILFNNVPILLLRGNLQTVYFHNMNYLKYISFQKIYFFCVIKFKLKTTYFVQSKIVALELQKYFKGKIKVAKHPLVDYYNKLISNTVSSQIILSNKILQLDQNSYIYPAYFYPHKNHLLLKEYENIFAINKVKIYLTIDEGEYLELFPNSTTIINLGKLRNIDILMILKKIKGLINVSLNESFMLPIIEAMILKKQVITLKKDYSKFLLKEKGLYFFNKESLDIALKKGKPITEINDYDFSNIDCNYNQFINQFLNF